ncbi:MAG: serine/threonine-protein kinase, partial [Planctomycetota bacterium]|nr:serine/threonine-protein kinase [Planctomycetota bacterium]
MIDQKAIDNLVARWQEHWAKGQEVSAQQLCQDCPELTDSVDERIQSLKAQARLTETAQETADESAVVRGSTQRDGSARLSTQDGSSPATTREKLSGSSRYRILNAHAKGGLGEVFVAQDEELDRHVALKEIQSQYAFDKDKQARFLREAQITGNLEHPGIVPVYGLGHYQDGRPYYAMRFIKGDTLRDAIDRFHRAGDYSNQHSRLELRKLLNRFIDVCNAMEYAHSRKVVHRDIKPSNVMLGQYGETLVVDWGLARITSRKEETNAHPESSVYQQPTDMRETMMGSTLGTPAYMSPEQAAGDLQRVGPSADIYSLGATLYHLLTGKPPVTDQSAFLVLEKVQRGEFPSPRSVNDSVPRPLEAICHQAMSLQPEDRYQSALALAEDIEHWLGDEPVAAYEESLTERTGRWVRAHRGTTVAGGGALTLVAVVSIVAAVLVGQAQDEESMAWETAAKSRLFELKLLEGPEWTVPGLAELDQMLDEISAISPEDAEIRRRRLFDSFTVDMEGDLKKPRFGNDDSSTFDAQLDAFAGVFPDSDGLLAELRKARDARLGQWNELIESETLLTSDFGSVFDGSTMVVTDGTIRRRTSVKKMDGNGQDTVPTRLSCPPGSVELKATFGRNWTMASVIGLVLNLSDSHRYDFLLTVPQFDYRDSSPEDLARLPPSSTVLQNMFNNRLQIFILRDGQPLAGTSISVPAERLRLLARRVGGTLSFTVNDKHTIQFEDPFPLPATDSGVFGVYLPEDVELDDLQAMHLRTAEKPSPVEHGDELFALAQFSDAATEYRRIGNAECQYKRALCLLRVQQTEEAIAILKELFGQAPEADETPDDAWRLRAGCSLLQHYVEDRDWSEVDDILDELANFYSPEKIALLIPKTQIDMILQHRRRERYGAFLWARGRNLEDDLNWTIRVEKLFNLDPVRRRRTRATLASIHQWNLKRDEALAIWEKLLAEIERDDATLPAERIHALTLWAYHLKVKGQSLEAIEKLDSWLFDKAGSLQKDYLPLLMIRAMCFQSLGDVTKAADDLDLFLETATKDSVDYLHYSGVCVLRGMLYEDVGDHESAAKVFRDGLRRNWPTRFGNADKWRNSNGYSTILAFAFNAILMSWTGEMTEQEAEQLWDMFIPGSGVISASVKNVARTAMTPALVRKAVVDGFRTPLARQAVKDWLSSGWYASTSMRIVLHPIAEGVRELALRDLVLSKEEQAEVDVLLVQEGQRFIDAYTAGIYDDKDLQVFLDLVRGKFQPAAFNRLIDKHPRREFSMWIAMVFGNKFALDGNDKVARYLFDL